MLTIIISLLALWLVVMFKKLLLWGWFWQLKEYHLGRARTHFDTYNGRRLLLDKLALLKLALLVLLFINIALGAVLLFAVYLIELVLFWNKLRRRQLIRPKPTLKALVIIGTGSAVLALLAGLIGWLTSNALVSLLVL